MDTFAWLIEHQGATAQLSVYWQPGEGYVTALSVYEQEQVADDVVRAQRGDQVIVELHQVQTYRRDRFVRYASAQQARFEMGEFDSLITDLH